jgi:hypothetical protein
MRSISQIAKPVVEKVGVFSMDTAVLCGISATECLPPNLRKEIVLLLNQLRDNGCRLNDRFVPALRREVVPTQPQTYTFIPD